MYLKKKKDYTHTRQKTTNLNFLDILVCKVTKLISQLQQTEWFEACHTEMKRVIIGFINIRAPLCLRSGAVVSFGAHSFHHSGDGHADERPVRGQGDRAG